MALTIQDVRSGNSGGTNVSSFTLPTVNPPPTGSLVVVVMVSVQGSAVVHQAPTDNFSSTYTQLGSTLSVTLNTLTCKLSKWICDGIPTIGFGLQVTMHTSLVATQAGVVWNISDQKIGGQSYNGDIAALSGTNTAPHSGTSAPAPQGLSIFIGGHSLFNSGTPTEASGWNAVGSNGFTSAMHTAALLSDNVVGQSVFSEYFIAATAQDAAWTLGASDTWVADVASFLQVGATPSPNALVPIQQRM